MVNKFGNVTDRQTGNETISLYYWDKKQTVANGKNTSFSSNGLFDQITLTVMR